MKVVTVASPVLPGHVHLLGEIFTLTLHWDWRMPSLSLEVSREELAGGDWPPGV